MQIGYHCSHEQFSPGELLRLSIKAESAGFDAALSSDHFHPWSEVQGQSGFAWSWLGAALQATSLSFGVVCSPGQRYHPAIIAQASATLSEMFPERFWIAAGSGQLLNEGITGDRWPPRPERNIRLQESAEAIRDLWAGRTVTRYGRIRIEEATLHSLPKTSPLLIGAAISPETAEWAGSWADGLITISQDRESVRKVIEAFHRGGGEEKPMFLKTQVSYAKTEGEAERGAWEQWRSASFGNTVLPELRTPSQFEEAAKHIAPEDIHRTVRVSANMSRHIDWLFEDLEMGFERIFIHNVNRGQERFIEEFGAHALPALRGVAASR